jgi:O-antigen/teichoic acid export membrane protein
MFNTIGTRMISAVLSLGIWILNANILGAEKVGTISLMIFSVSIIQLVTNFISGAALIYYTPRIGVAKLMAPAYTLTPLLTLLSCYFLQFTGNLFPVARIIPLGYFYEVMALSLVMSLTSANFMFLLGLEKVNKFNMINLLQIVVLALLLLVWFFLFRHVEVESYFWAMFLSYSLALLLSSLPLVSELKNISFNLKLDLLRDILRFGTFVQFANIFQIMNYRLSLKFVDMFLSRSAVGVLTIGAQLAEGLWLISRSIGTVQYSRLSNAMDDRYSVRLTLTLAKISMIITTLAMATLLAIPLKVFLTIFPPSFSEIKLVIASLSVGIIMLSVSIIFSGFYSAVNRPYHNTISSAIGLIFTVVCGLYLIPRYGIAGAGLTASISYSVITFYQAVVFLRMPEVSVKDFLLTRAELSRFFHEMMKLAKNRG